MASIGSASLVLSTNSAKLTQGLDQAGAKVRSWAGQTQQAVSTKFSGLASSLSMGLKAGIAGLAVGAGLGGIGGIISEVKELAQVGKQAKSLGIASDQFMGLTAQMKKFGVEGEGSVKMFAKLGSKVNEAAQGNQQLAAEFSKLGLNAKDLSGMSLDKQFIAVADAISKLPNNAQQAQLAMKLFEEEGLKILPLLQKGGPEIQKTIDKMKAMGVALNQTDMDKMIRAQQAIPKLGMAFEGVKNKILIALAPVIELVANKLTSAMTALQPVFEWVGRAVSTHWGIIADIIGEVVDAVWDVIKTIGEWITELFDLGNVSVTIEEVVTGVWKAIGIGAAYVWDTIKAGAGAVAYVASYIVDGFGLVVDVFKEIISLAKELPDDLRPDWLDGLIAGTDKFSKSVKGTAEGMRKWGKGTFDNFGKSADDVDKWFEKRKNKKQEPIEANKAGELVGPQKQATYTAVAAAMKDSKEAYSIEARFKTNNMLNPQIDAQRKQLQEQQKANQLLKDVKEAVGKIGEKALAIL